MPFLDFADAVAPAMLLAQAIGRIGNYFNQELFGSPTTLPWGLEIDPDQPAFPAGLPADTLFHPLFLYELLWNLLGFAVILLLERRLQFRRGWALGAYFVWYGLGRAWFESFRLDPTEFILFGLKINIITALAVMVLGVVIVVLRRGAAPSAVSGAAPAPPEVATAGEASSEPAGAADPTAPERSGDAASGSTERR